MTNDELKNLLKSQLSIRLQVIRADEARCLRVVISLNDEEIASDYIYLEELTY